MDKEKKIDVGASSLVDLKAELHRKQQESRTLRHGADRPPSTSSKSSGKTKVWAKTNAGVERRDQRDREEIERETKDLDRSRAVLEAKARAYDRLQTGTEALEDDATNERFLVNFQQKAIDNVARRRQRRAAETEESSVEPVNADDEWVEFTDSLGRSRTVMRRDLAEYQRRDLESRRPTDDQGPSPELVSEDGRREQQRQLWERQELENAAKRDIHYQDVLFNEARAHGAGYFAFSQDAEERARQRADLDELRDHTETQQSRAELARKRKNKQLKERLRKVRERKRLKLGLPIEDRLEKEEEEAEEEEGVEKAAPAATALTPEEINRRLEEQRREQERQSFIREWDLGKEGVANKKPVLTQEQWVEQQRKDRPAEFAPPAQYEPRRPAPGRGRPSAVSRAAQAGGPARPAPPQGTERPPADRTGSQPQPQPCSPEGRRHQASAAQLSTDAGQTPADTTSMPSVGQLPPSMGQPPPNMGQPPPNIGQPPPNMEQPPPNMGQPPPNMGQTPPNMGQPPPNMGQPPPNMGQLPPYLRQPPLSMGRMEQPPSGVERRPADMVQPPPTTDGRQPASSGPLSGRSARVASYRARRAAAADLLDPDGGTPAGTEGSGRGAGAEVEPPATAEYFGGTRRGRRQAAARPDVGSAIEAGLALLSEDTEQKHSKTFDL